MYVLMLQNYCIFNIICAECKKISPHIALHSSLSDLSHRFRVLINQVHALPLQSVAVTVLCSVSGYLR